MKENEFYTPIVNHLYSELLLFGLAPQRNFTPMMDGYTLFFDPFTFIEAKHKQAEYKDILFYKNLIEAMKDYKPKYSEIWDLSRYDDDWDLDKGNFQFNLGLEEIESKIVDYCKNKIYELENGIDGNDKEFKKKDLAERLLIIYFLREENLFPKFDSTTKLETETGHNEFLGILLSENENTIKKNFSESISKIIHPKKNTEGNKKKRIEQLENVKKYFQKINHQGIIVKIEQLITDTRNHS